MKTSTWAPSGSAFTMATFCAMVRLPEPMFQARVAGPPLATIWSRQLWSSIVDSRAADPPSRTTTGLVGVLARMEARAASTRDQSPVDPALAPVAVPALPLVAAFEPAPRGLEPAVACAEHATAAAAENTRATSKAMVT